MLDEKQKEEFFVGLRIKGATVVKQDLAQGIYGRIDDPRSKAPLVKDWLASEEAIVQEKNYAEEMETSKEANTIAKEANKLSKWAIAISIIALLFSFFMRQ
jgi:hypothetical protein